MTTELQQQQLIEALMQPDCYLHAVDNLRLLETHISWVFLTGPYAYKIKKPVDLGFLDFSTLEKRHYYCDEELRLNRRLAPSIYIDVVTITGSPQQPQWQGTGAAIEYAVKMVQFPQAAQLDRMLARGELGARHIDAIAQSIAEFHQQIAVAGDDSAYGDVEHVYQPVAENLTHIRHCVNEADTQVQLDYIEQWSRQRHVELSSIISERKAAGFIRECHGDLHLRNLAWVDGRPLVFDCIEFNPNLRWIDVISEIAFLVMDLHDRQQPQLAWRFLNSYLTETGDYSGVRMLSFYLCYRAMVRAKVDAIRLSQPHLSEAERDEAHADFHGYLQLARACIEQPQPLLVIMRGLSASGKTTLSQPLLEQLGAIRLRSDVERKRLAGMSPLQRGGAAVDKGIYRPQFSEQTYAHLLTQASAILEGGYTVIVDAAFLQYERRQPFRQLAAQMRLPFIILELQATHGTLRQRITARSGDASDADLAVLEQQIKHWQPLDVSEQEYVMQVDTETGLQTADLVAQIEQCRR